MGKWQKLCMHLIAKAIRVARAKFNCNRLTTVQDIQDYGSLILLALIVYYVVAFSGF